MWWSEWEWWEELHQFGLGLSVLANGASVVLAPGMEVVVAWGLPIMAVCTAGYCRGSEVLRVCSVVGVLVARGGECKGGPQKVRNLGLFGVKAKALMKSNACGSG